MEKSVKDILFYSVFFGIFLLCTYLFVLSLWFGIIPFYIMLVIIALYSVSLFIVLGKEKYQEALKMEMENRIELSREVFIELNKMSPFLTVFFVMIFIFWIFLIFSFFGFRDEAKIYSQLRVYCKNNSLMESESVFSTIHNFGWFPRLSNWIENEYFQEAFFFFLMIAWILYIIFMVRIYPLFVIFILGTLIFVLFVEMYNNNNNKMLEGYVYYNFKVLNREILDFINKIDIGDEDISVEERIFTFINDINDLLNLNIFGRASIGVEAWNISHKKDNLSIIHNLTYKFERFVHFLLINKKIEFDPETVKTLTDLIKSLRNELEFEMDRFPKIPISQIIGGALSVTSALLYII